MSSLPSPEDPSTEEIQALENAQAISRNVQTGKRTVSAAFLSSLPPPSGTPSLASGSTVTVCFRGFDQSSNAQLVFPEVLDSVATLGLIGFDEQTAQTIFTRWTQRGESPDGLLAYVHAHIARINTFPHTA